MQKRKLLLIPFLLGLSTVNLNAEKIGDIEYDRSSVIVKMKDSVRVDKKLEKTIENNISTKVDNIDILNPNNKEQGDLVVVEFTQDNQVLKASKELDQMSMVDYVQPNYLYKSTKNIDMKSDCGAAGKWYLQTNHLNPNKVKSQLSGKPTVEVGVIDSGITASHSEFSGRYNSAKSYDYVNRDRTPNDTNGHGTHVSGIIAGNTSGVSSNTKLVSYRVLDGQGYGYSSDMIAAIYKANRDGVKIINISAGAEQFDGVLFDAISKYNGLVVAAAGNDNSSKVDYPAAYNLDNVIAVGAHTSSYNRAVYSDYNKYNVDLFAPGDYIRSASSRSNNAFTCMSGTSMAAPTVSASAAMNLANNTNQSMKELKNSIMDGANSNLSKSPARSKLSGLSLSSGSLSLDKGFDATKNGVTNVFNYAKHKATLSSGTLKLSGNNAYGQIGNGNTVQVNTPYQVVLPNNQKVVKYYLTSKNTYIITNQNKLYVSGSNDQGQLGHNKVKSSNKFVEFKKISNSHNIKRIDFRNAYGAYDENAINIILRDTKDSISYKLGNSSYVYKTDGYKNSKTIQLVEMTNHRKKNVKFYNNNRGLSAQESFFYHKSSGYLTKRVSYLYNANYNRIQTANYDRILKSYATSDYYKNGKRKYYNIKTNKVTKKFNKRKYDYDYSSKLYSNNTNYYNTRGVITKKVNYRYNKYGKLRLQNRSKATATIITYNRGKYSVGTTYLYNAKGKKYRNYKRVINYSKNKVAKKREYYFRSGKLKSTKKQKAYYYITSYKKGKAKKTYRYTYTNKGKLSNKKQVKRR